MSSRTNESAPQHSALTAAERVRAFVDLTKPRIALLVIVIAAGSFSLASPRALDWGRLAQCVLGTTLLAFGIFALNHFAERETDRRMYRTRQRPLPSRRVEPRDALIFGATLTAAATAGITVFLGLAAGVVAFCTFVSYILVYTPLKQRTMHHTIPGAIAGAMPPLLGWACARGTLDLNAWVLFAILFFWQFPHFLALELMYRDDYARGGIRVITAAHVSKAAVVIEIVLAMALLLASCAAPFFSGLAGAPYLVFSLLLGAAFAVLAVRAAVRRDARSGKALLRASVIYLPLVFLALVLSSL